MRESAAPGTVRAAILVTGTEVLTGRRQDRNGPWLSERMREVGAEVTTIAVVGDHRPEMLATLRFIAAQQVDLVVTSGGLGPTADDLTTEVVAEAQGRPMALDERLEARIAAIVAPLRERFPGIDPTALEAGTRKQATIPAGATVLDPVGTAPGLIVPPGDSAGPLVLVLPGPPRELQPMWRAALEVEPLRSLLARAAPVEQGLLLLFGIPESEIAETLRAAESAGIALDRLDVTTCLHRGEIEMATAFAPAARADYEQLAAFVAERHPKALFSTDGATVDEQVASRLLARSLTIATAESCTGGLLAARLTSLPGSSSYVRGGLVTYANEAKVSLAHVDGRIISEHGAVSREVAAGLARGACDALGADVGVGVTGVAGPGGGSAEKPVGLVWISVTHPRANDSLTRSVTLPGSREDVRQRATTVAMHMVRILLARES
ncbi:MAG: competence/damage-inducible protein A [Acidobacteriota bacterium]|nr:competence/damage-inducible protein A [Acidobacteriota bacterium]